PVGPGARYRAEPVGHTGPGGQRRNADPPGGLGEPLGRKGGGLLVADVDDLDALGEATVVDREQMPAGQREEVRAPARCERLGDESTPVLQGREPMDNQGARVAKLAKAAPLKGAAP